ncbi:MAG: CbiX/SirB N-terminal domain-containing protein, partial [Phycisphaerae bacterium]
AKLVVVHPYFLAPGRHSTTDIPRLTAAAAEKHPGIRYHVTAPLGLDEKITQVIEQRVLECSHAGYTCEYCHGRPACTRNAGVPPAG